MVGVGKGKGVSRGVGVGRGVAVDVGVDSTLSTVISGSHTGPACNKTAKSMRSETIDFMSPLIRASDRDHFQQVDFCQIENDVLSGGSVEGRCLQHLVVEAKTGGIDAETVLLEVCEHMAAVVNYYRSGKKAAWTSVFIVYQQMKTPRK